MATHRPSSFPAPCGRGRRDGRITAIPSGEGFAERDFNSIQNGWQIRHYLIGPETKHAKAVALQPNRASRIMRGLFGFAVLASVDFDHQPRRQANEIGKIWPKWKLPT